VRQGDTEARSDLREVPADDKEWWTSVEEGYWYALLEQGEVAVGMAPVADPQGSFQVQDVEPEIDPRAAEPVTDGTGEFDPKEDWQSAQLALAQGDSFCLKISGANRGGVLVDWNGLQGFIPASHLKEMPRSPDPHERAAQLAGRIGDTVTVRMIEVDAEQKKLVFSERAAILDAVLPADIWNTLRPADVCQGTVTNLTSFGAFVDLGGIEGLIHISEISWDRVHHPSDALYPGQEVEVYILGVNPGEKRIALSLKRLRPDPWSHVAAHYQVGEVIEGTITNVVSFGAFVRVEEGLEGLIHISELAEGSFLHPRNVVHEGDRVRVRVLKIDPVKHHLGLSLRQAHAGELGE
jgi:small subunit ribosomal protein S1